jgi:hypothetical protein
MERRLDRIEAWLAYITSAFIAESIMIAGAFLTYFVLLRRHYHLTELQDERIRVIEVSAIQAIAKKTREKELLELIIKVGSGGFVGFLIERIAF